MVPGLTWCAPPNHAELGDQAAKCERIAALVGALRIKSQRPCWAAQPGGSSRWGRRGHTEAWPGLGLTRALLRDRALRASGPFCLSDCP